MGTLNAIKKEGNVWVNVGSCLKATYHLLLPVAVLVLLRHLFDDLRTHGAFVPHRDAVRALAVVVR